VHIPACKSPFEQVRHWPVDGPKQFEQFEEHEKLQVRLVDARTVEL
jgi:hypothetical protein